MTTAEVCEGIRPGTASSIDISSLQPIAGRTTNQTHGVTGTYSVNGYANRFATKNIENIPNGWPILHNTKAGNQGNGTVPRSESRNVQPNGSFMPDRMSFMSFNADSLSTPSSPTSSKSHNHNLSVESYPSSINGPGSIRHIASFSQPKNEIPNNPLATNYDNGLGTTHIPQSVIAVVGMASTNSTHDTSQNLSNDALSVVPENRSSASSSLGPGLQSQGHATNSGISNSTATSLRHRHTLQVPKPSSGKQQGPGVLSTTTGMDDVSVQVPERASTNRSNAGRRASMSLARKPTRSIHSDFHVEDITQDEDSQKWAEAIKAKRASKRKRKEEENEDEVLVGIKVDMNHANYVTMYNMLTGIRFVVSRCNAKMDRPLTDADFDAAHKFSFDIMGSELTPSAKYDFKFKDYAPWVFRHLRARFKLDPGDYLMSLTSRYILSELGSPGKSGSFFYFSRDYKYIIKTIHHAEHRFLRKILRDYYNHVTTYPNTLISQFFGLHRVKIPFGRKIHFVIMNNIFPPHKDIHMTFDLKGSTIGREYKEDDLESNPRAVLKDLNWVRRDMHLTLGPVKQGLFLRQAQLDVELLKRLKIMDYSLLVGIHDMNRGNNDNLREKNLQVFQPGSAATEDLNSHALARTPSKLESIRKRAEMRKMIRSEVPISLEQSENRLPEEFETPSVDPGPRSIFNGDDHGFRSTSDQDQPGDVIYYLGIIDCLTKYDLIKRGEHFWKGLSQDKHAISAVPPESYGDRFYRFISSIIPSYENGTLPANTRLSSDEAAPTLPISDHMALEGQIPDRKLTTARIALGDREGQPSTILPVVQETGENQSNSSNRSLQDDTQPTIIGDLQN